MASDAALALSNVAPSAESAIARRLVKPELGVILVAVLAGMSTTLTWLVSVRFT